MTAHGYCPGHGMGYEPVGDSSDLRAIECPTCVEDHAAREIVEALCSAGLPHGPHDIGWGEGCSGEPESTS